VCRIVGQFGERAASASDLRRAAELQFHGQIRCQEPISGTLVEKSCFPFPTRFQFLIPTAELAKTERGPISTSGPMISVWHQTGRSLRKYQSVCPRWPPPDRRSFSRGRRCSTPGERKESGRGHRLSGTRETWVAPNVCSSFWHNVDPWDRTPLSTTPLNVLSTW